MIYLVIEKNTLKKNINNSKNIEQQQINNKQHQHINNKSIKNIRNISKKYKDI